MKTIEDHIFALDNFEGSLDFLLHLIQKSEIDIYEIPLHKITEQYLVRLGELISPAVDSGAEFIGTAASLLLLKSKMLLPKQEQSETAEVEEIDPRFEIIHQLIEYCRFKEAAKEFSEREQKQNAFFPRGIECVDIKKNLGIEHLSMQDLASLFQQVMSKAVSHQGLIHEEVWLVADKIQLLRQSFKETQKIRFDAFFSPERSREELIVTFLAILELMKLGELRVINDPSEDAIFIIQPNDNNGKSYTE
jgi:segregation and condensation protein A